MPHESSDSANVNPPSPRRRPVPDELFGGRLRGTYLLDLRVARADTLADHVRAITFESPDLVGFEHEPGQDLMIEFPQPNRTTRRRYTIRRSNPTEGTIDIEFEVHGHGVAAQWAEHAQVGDTLEAIGPRGAITLDTTAASNLFIADDSALPAVAAMIEALPIPTAITALLLTDQGPESRPFTDASASVTWITADQLDDTIADLTLAADTASYVFGERHLVTEAVEALTEAGVPADAIRSKAYWRRDQPNADHGEPARS